jgi:hypothetical protein
MKKIFLCAATFLTSLAARSQNADPMINILADPGAVKVATNGLVRTEVINAGSDPIIANSLEVTIGMAANGEITGLAPGSSASWTITSMSSGSGNTVKLQNTGGGIAADALQEIVLVARGNTVSGASTITSNIVYIAAQNPVLGGAPNAIQGNASPANDNSTTSLAVTAGTPLPVGLTTFSGSMANCEASLGWAVNASMPYERFGLEQSTDGQRFGTVTELKAESGKERYSYTLRQQTARSFYRLKMTDRSGNASYSNTLSLTADCMQSAAGLSPNPTRSSVRLTGLVDGGSVRVYNQFGAVVMQKLNASDQVDLSALPAGLYRISWDSEAGVVTRSVTKL